MQFSCYNGSRLKAQGSRDNIADALRGLAIILVIVGHVLGGFQHSNLIFPGVFSIKTAIYIFHMPLFFMIAGYSHGMKDHFSGQQKFSHYLKKYAVELYLPAMYFSLLYWLPKYFFLSTSNNIENVTLTSLANFYSIPLKGFNEYWFLCVLFFVKAIHIFFEAAFRDDRANTLFWALLLVVLSLALGQYPGNRNDFSWDGFMINFAFGFYFHAGYLLRRKGLITEDTHPKISLGLALLTVGLITFALSDSNLLARHSTAICISLSLFIIFYALRIDNGFLAVCGASSMVIYCLHNYTAYIMRLVFRFAGMSGVVHSGLLFVVSSAACVVLPLFVVWLYKNVKCFRWAEYIFYPGRLLLKH